MEGPLCKQSAVPTNIKALSLDSLGKDLEPEWVIGMTLLHMVRLMNSSCMIS